jgi:hypothetical protein
MQQLVGQSPWDWIPVWEHLAKRMTAELEPDSAWVVDDTGFPKQGEHSVGVERQYSGTLGKVGNCQVAVSVHHVGEQGHSILGWRLYLPESWTKDRQRRAEAGIPEDLVFQTKWQLGLEIIDQACQGRSKTRPLRRGKSRPEEQVGDRGLSGRRTAGAKACAACKAARLGRSGRRSPPRGVFTAAGRGRSADQELGCEPRLRLLCLRR